MHYFTSLDDVLRDVRFALRQLAKSPGFTAAAVLTLALGIGTATAMFAVINDLLLEPLPVPNAARLYVGVGTDAKGNENVQEPFSTIRQWREAAGQSAQIAFNSESQTVLSTPRGALLAANVASSTDLFRVLGAQPVLGRSFLPEEAEDSKSHVALLSYGTWRDAFSADPQILGKAVRLDGVPYSVIGIMPPRFSFPIDAREVQIWTPMERSRLAASVASNEYGWLNPVILARSGADVSSIQTALSGVQARIAHAARPGEEGPIRIRLVSLRERLVGDIRPALSALEVAVALVWFIACCNVAGVLLARFAARRTEIALRGALGAGMARLVRQFLTESLLLSFAGAAAGVGLAIALLRAFRHMLERYWPLPVSIHLHGQVSAALIGLSMVTGLAFGVVPALLAAHAPPEAALKSGGRSASADRGQSRLRDLLLVCEVAVSVILLVASGLMLRTVRSLQHVPLGFRTDHILFTNVTIPADAYRNADVATTVWPSLLARVRRLPGVRAAALSTVLPIGHSLNWLTRVYKTGWTKGDVTAEVRAASPGLMDVLGIRLRAGRFFTEEDVAGSMPAAVVNQIFVDRYLGGGDALGKQIRFGRVPSSATIVGVIEDVRQDAISTPSQAELYLCMAQIKPGSALYLPLLGRFMQFAVRTHTAPDAMIPAFTRAIREENPELGIGDVTTMTQSVEDSMGSQRMAAAVIGIFGGLALLITAVGLYGVLMYAVTQRTREIGIRMALGAGRRQVIGLVLRKAVVLLAFGIVIGLAAALWSSRLLQSFLYGVGRHDPWALAMGAAVLFVSGLIAALIPAGRAASIEPMQALRME
jgi:predicted permease